jgi:SAM-dependent methyltransferase
MNFPICILSYSCGPGIISRYLAQYHVREVVGIDLTKGMIDLAYKESQASNIRNCLWMIGDMTNLPFHDESFDGVVTRYTFHHLQHPIQALTEMIRVTAKGGHIMVLDATPHKDKKDAYNHFERLRDPSHTTALYPLELISLSSSCNSSIELVATQSSSLTLDAIGLINRAFPVEVNREELLHLLRSDVGINALDFNARYSNDVSSRLLVSFPQTIVVWKKL